MAPLPVAGPRAETRKTFFIFQVVTPKKKNPKNKIGVNTFRKSGGETISLILPLQIEKVTPIWFQMNFFFTQGRGLTDGPEREKKKQWRCKGGGGGGK